MAQITITISNREYAIACEDGQEGRILQLANILDDKAKAFAESSPYIAENMLLAMVALVLADELSDLKKAKKEVPVQSAPVIDNSRILELDKLIAQEIKNTAEQIKSIANKVELL